MSKQSADYIAPKLKRCCFNARGILRGVNIYNLKVEKFLLMSI